MAYVAAITSTIGLDVSVIVLPHREPVLLAKMVATIDQLSRGRMIIGVGLGGNALDAAFGVTGRRVRRFTEMIEVMDAFWTQPRVAYEGDFFQLDNAVIEPKPAQKPRPPLWIGARVEPAVRRAVRIGDGWMGQGPASTALFKKNVEGVHRFLDEADRDPATFAISKRVYVAVDDDENRALRRLREWIDHRYGRPGMAEEVSVWGSRDRVMDGLQEVTNAGAEHLLINPVFDLEEHLEIFGEAL